LIVVLVVVVALALSYRVQKFNFFTFSNKWLAKRGLITIPRRSCRFIYAILIKFYFSMFFSITVLNL